MERISRLVKIAILTAVCLLMMSIPAAVEADVAPPETPPGSNPNAGNEQTQVQMMSEVVTLNIIAVQTGKGEYASDFAQAKVTAHFVMHNQGSADEKMQVRFPLMDPKGWGDERGNFPEIGDLTASVDQKPATITKITTSNPNNTTDPGVSWAAFDVTFPVGKDVIIDVAYTLDAMGYLPYGTFNYILQTGAGWKDAIGTADIIVRLPYEANEMNVMPSNAYPSTTPNGQFTSNEIHWHYENLEPQPSDNFEVSIVLPYAWQAILDAQKTTQSSPKNGDAWGTLARAYKQIYFMTKGMRDDPGGSEIYQSSVDAYEKAVSLAPKTARWHAGYGELLWNHYYYSYFFSDPNNQAELLRSLQELKTALSLDANNQQAKDSLNNMCYEMPEALQCTNSGYVYVALTATLNLPSNTPMPSTETPIPLPTKSQTAIPSKPTVTLQPKPTDTVQPTQGIIVTDTKAAPIEPTATPQKKSGGSICPSATLAPLLLFVIGYILKRRSNV